MQIDQPDDAILLLSAIHVLRSVGPYMLTQFEGTKVAQSIGDDTHRMVDEISNRLIPELQRVAERKYTIDKESFDAREHPFLALSSLFVNGADEMGTLLGMLAAAQVVDLRTSDPEPPSHPGAYL